MFQPKIWGKYDLSFELSEPEAYRRDVSNAQVHVRDAGHFALDTKRIKLRRWQVNSWRRRSEHHSRLC